jgi:hypothetical protein
VTDRRMQAERDGQTHASDRSTDTDGRTDGHWQTGRQTPPQARARARARTDRRAHGGGQADAGRTESDLNRTSDSVALSRSIWRTGAVRRTQRGGDGRAGAGGGGRAAGGKPMRDGSPRPARARWRPGRDAGPSTDQGAGAGARRHAAGLRVAARRQSQDKYWSNAGRMLVDARARTDSLAKYWSNLVKYWSKLVKCRRRGRTDRLGEEERGDDPPVPLQPQPLLPVDHYYYLHFSLTTITICILFAFFRFSTRSSPSPSCPLTTTICACHYLHIRPCTCHYLHAVIRPAPAPGPRAHPRPRAKAGRFDPPLPTIGIRYRTALGRYRVWLRPPLPSF